MSARIRLSFQPLGAEAVCQRPLQQRHAQTFAWPGVQPRAPDGYRLQRVDALHPLGRSRCMPSAERLRLGRLVCAWQLASKPLPARFMMRLSGSVKLSCALSAGAPNSRSQLPAA
jgi:hypothetical protein